MLITLSITGCTIEYFLFIHPLFIITFVTFYTTHNTSPDKLYKTFKWDWAGARSQLVPPPTGFTLLNILRIIWWYPHLTTRTTPHPSPLHTERPSPTWIRSNKSILILNVLTQTSKPTNSQHGQNKVVCLNNCHGNGQSKSWRGLGNVYTAWEYSAPLFF